VKEAAKGAESEGAEIIYFDLYRQEKFTGCISCFGCKKEASLGKCACKDGLTPILDAMREADGVILGTPNYLGNISSGLRALYERLVFQSLTYKKELRTYNDRPIPVLFIMTSNCNEEMYEKNGYDKLLEGYQRSLGTFVGNTKLLVAGNTLQVNDYSPYGWSMFDPDAKKAYHDEHFGEKIKEAFALGSEMAKTPW
ncbi:MAG: flavodoxin family protein, partial [Eubacteriaceae bacterium]|nr:flavodoxin family protein [Eubacteriaceae bacterium]